MEEEIYLTGYCRCLDGSRVVEVIVENGRFAEADCSYGSCPHEAVCLIAREIEKIPE